jgi:hypothetical protein
MPKALFESSNKAFGVGKRPLSIKAQNALRTTVFKAFWAFILRG